MKRAALILLIAVLLLAACGNPTGSGGASDGSAEFVIVIDPVQPLTVTLAADPEGPLSRGDELTVSAAVTGGTGVYSYRWYLDGQREEGEEESAISVDTDRDPARYRLTLVASDGTRAGSASVLFDVEQ